MTGTMAYNAIIFLFVLIIEGASSYKFLGVFPLPVPSNSILGNSLMRGLAEKGHDVTVITPYPMKNAPKNCRLVESPSILEALKDRHPIQFHDHDAISTLLVLYDMSVLITNLTLAEPSVQKLMASDEKFDAVIVLIAGSEALLGLAEHFNASLIAISSLGANQWSTDLVGTPSPPSYVPNVLLKLTNRMTLSERILNLAVTTFEHIYFNNFYMARQRDIFKKYFPKSKLGLDSIRKNTAMVLLNSHVSLGFPRPYVPNMIEVGGMQINRQRKPLPDDMQKFLDEAKDGAIYFSLGTYIKAKTLPFKKRQIILQTLKALKQRVLWKFEDSHLPGKSDNVYISDWFPQDDILAHPNVKLFITHGGLLSTTESIYHGKAFIGIPLFLDQFLNMEFAEIRGYGIKVDYQELSKETLLAAINEMLQNPKYTEMVKVVSDRYHDQPMEPLDLAVYWVEYVVRHKGAPHLHSAGQDLNFIQYHNLDAIAILFGGILFVLLVLLRLVFILVLRCLGLLKTRTKVKEN